MEIKQEDKNRLHYWVPSENDTRFHCKKCGLYEDYGHLPCEPWTEKAGGRLVVQDKRKA